MYKPEFNGEKFRALMLYAAHKSRDDVWFGAVKLNKILYYCDFRAYSKLYRSITGATYFNLPEGPAPREMPTERRVLVDTGQAKLKLRKVFIYVQHRLEPTEKSIDVHHLFDQKEMVLIDEVIDALKPFTGKQVSDISHAEEGWRLTNSGEDIPYETVWLAREDDIEVEMIVESADHLEREAS